jgi:lipopolysaccharide export system ATP-binding protein
MTNAAQSESTAHLEARGLVKSYGSSPVVRGVDLEMRAGEIVGLLGRNGAGKTTIFQMIVGLIRPDSGRILLDGVDISSRPTHERAGLGLTYLPQENSVFLKATVADNVRMALELQPGFRKEDLEPATGRLLDDLGLRTLSGQPAYSLSGGERRRLEICRALTVRPKFLLLDEPFTGIDPLTIIELQRILLMLRDRSIGILISDHNVRDTFRVVSRAYVIDEGEILVEDEPRAIVDNAQARERFLGSDFRMSEEDAGPARSSRMTPGDRPGSLPENKGKAKNRPPRG